MKTSTPKPESPSLTIHIIDRIDTVRPEFASVFFKAIELSRQKGIRIHEHENFQSIINLLQSSSHALLVPDLDSLTNTTIIGSNKNLRAITPVALIECFEQHRRIPASIPLGLHSNSMRNVFATTTGLSRASRNEVFKRIRQMGGRTNNMFISDVTHLITTNESLKQIALELRCLSMKYTVAFRLNVPVVDAQWCNRVYNESHSKTDVNASQFVSEYLIRPLQGVRIGLSPNINPQLRSRLNQILKELTGFEESDNGQIVLHSSTNESELNFRWIVDSYLAGGCYIVDPTFYGISYSNAEFGRIRFHYSDDEDHNDEANERIKALRGNWNFIDESLPIINLSSIRQDWPFTFKNCSVVAIPDTSKHYQWITRVFSFLTNNSTSEQHLIVCPIIVPPCAIAFFSTCNSFKVMSISYLGALVQKSPFITTIPEGPLIYRSWGRRPLEGCVFSLTGLKTNRLLRCVICEITRILGGDIGQIDLLVRTTKRESVGGGKNSTHLLVGDSVEMSSSKCKAAQKWGIHVVGIDWLYRCFQEGRRINEIEFTSRVESQTLVTSILKGGAEALNEMMITQRSIKHSVSRINRDLEPTFIQDEKRNAACDATFVYSTPKQTERWKCDSMNRQNYLNYSHIEFNVSEINNSSPCPAVPPIDLVHSVRRTVASSNSNEKPGVLEGVVIACSRTLARYHVEYTDLVESMGGTVATKVTDPQCTHFVASYNPTHGQTSKWRIVVEGEIRDAVAKGLNVVSPSWITNCKRMNTRLDEQLYIPNKDARQTNDFRVLPVTKSSFDESTRFRSSANTTTNVLTNTSCSLSDSQDLFNLNADECTDESSRARKRSHSQSEDVIGDKSCLNLSKCTVKNIEYADKKSELARNMIFES